ncbi:MAG: hypothetical protein LC808_04840 [Actinobacteria bacterium]|nr:hypothetical protein [Actinomycetota bacterium]
MNLGSLRADQPLWVYVTDAAGRRNETGISVEPSGTASVISEDFTSSAANFSVVRSLAGDRVDGAVAEP